MYQTKYHKASSAAEAAKLLADAEDGALLAGGQTLIPTMKQRLASPSDLIDISGIEELRGITVDGDTITIGAMCTHSEIARDAGIASKVPAFSYLASTIGDAAVRHRGTIGGSIANNDPAADYPAAMLAMGATIKTDKREIAADDFFEGMFATALDDGEIITSVSIPVPEAAGYAKFQNPASRFPMAAVFVARTSDGIRVGVTGAGNDGAFRSSEMEQALSSDFSVDVLEGVSVDEGLMLSDIHGDAAYRANLVKVMAKRAVKAAG